MFALRLVKLESSILTFFQIAGLKHRLVWLYCRAATRS